MEYSKLFRMAYRAFTSLTGGGDAVWMALGPKHNGNGRAGFVLHMKGERKAMTQGVRDFLSGLTRKRA
jgi:hypothetical protein